MLAAIQRFDESAMRKVVRWQREPFLVFFRILTETGYGHSWFLASAFLWWATYQAHWLFLPQQAQLLFAMYAPFMCWGVGHGLKKRIRRPRPAHVLDNYTARGRTPKDASFPSSHASASVALFTFLTLVHHPIAAWVGLWSALLTFSRYYLGVHYPSDLVGGALLGVLCAVILYGVA